MRVLFLTQTPIQGGASRYRVHQYLSYLESKGVGCTVLPAITEPYFLKWFTSPRTVDKICYFSMMLARRLAHARFARKFDVVFLQRDIVPHIYPVAEKIFRTLNPKIVFDFDDAIFASPKTANPLFRIINDENRIPRIIRMSRHVVVGNSFLKEYALKYADNVTVIPTPIDTVKYRVRSEASAKTVVLGWSGSSSTNFYLNKLNGVLSRLNEKYDILLKVISSNTDKIMAKETFGSKFVFKKFDLNTEVDDLQDFDIGLMPLEDDIWSRGKCSFKALQYMGVGVPAVISPVGMNTEVVEDGVNGFLAGSDEEWYTKIYKLIEDTQLRRRIGLAGRKTVEEKYSVEANAPKLLKVLEDVYNST